MAGLQIKKQPATQSLIADPKSDRPEDNPASPGVIPPYGTADADFSAKDMPPTRF